MKLKLHHLQDMKRMKAGEKDVGGRHQRLAKRGLMLRGGCSGAEIYRVT